MPTGMEKLRALDKPRLAAVLLTALVIVFVFFDVVIGDLSRPRVLENFLGILLCGVLFGGAMLLALGPSRGGAGVIGAALVAWILYVVIAAPDAFDRTWPWWLPLGIAIAIGARGVD